MNEAPAKMSDAVSKPRVLLSIIKCACFEHLEGNMLFTAISAGHGRFECERLLKPSGVELMNLPHNAKIEVNVMRRHPAADRDRQKQLIYHGLVSLGALNPIFSEPEGGGTGDQPSIWENWLGLFGAEINMKGQSAEHWFQRCLDMGQSTARFPRLLLRLTYLPPGVAAPRTSITSGGVPSGSLPGGSIVPEVPRTSMQSAGRAASPVLPSSGVSAGRAASPVLPSSGVSGATTVGGRLLPSPEVLLSPTAPPVAAPPVVKVFNQGQRAEDGYAGGASPTGMQWEAAAANPGTVPTGGGSSSSMEERLKLMEMERSTWEKEKAVLEAALQNVERRAQERRPSAGEHAELRQAQADLAREKAGSREQAAQLESLRTQVMQLEQENLRLHERDLEREAIERNFFEQAMPLLERYGRLPQVLSRETAASAEGARARFAEVVAALGDGQAALGLAEEAVTRALSEGEAGFEAWLGSLPEVGPRARAQLTSPTGPRHLIACCRRVAALQAAAATPARSRAGRTGPDPDPTLFYKPVKTDPVDCLLAANLLRLDMDDPPFREFQRTGPGAYKFGTEGLKILCHIDAGRVMVRQISDDVKEEGGRAGGDDGASEAAAPAALDLRTFLARPPAVAAAR